MFSVYYNSQLTHIYNVNIYIRKEEIFQLKYIIFDNKKNWGKKRVSKINPKYEREEKIKITPEISNIGNKKTIKLVKPKLVLW